MGSCQSVPQEELNELIKTTRFKKQELQRWYSKFIKDYPDGNLNKEQFMQLYAKLYKSCSAQSLAGKLEFNRLSVQELNHFRLNQLSGGLILQWIEQLKINHLFSFFKRLTLNNFYFFKQ